MTVFDVMLKLEHAQDLINILEQKEYDEGLTSQEHENLEILRDYRHMLRNLKVSEL